MFTNSQKPGFTALDFYTARFYPYDSAFPPLPSVQVGAFIARQVSKVNSGVHVYGEMLQSLEDGLDSVLRSFAGIIS